MPNIGGIFTQNPSSFNVKEKNALQMQRLEIKGTHYSHYQFDSPGYSIGLLDHGILENGEQPVRSPRCKSILFMDGEIYNAEELKHTYRKYLYSRDISDGELCLLLIDKYGFKVLPELNGLFVFVIYDELNHKLAIIGDRFGFRPFYYLQRGNCLLFGSEIKAIAVADPKPREIDELGVLELFCYGHHIENRTSFTDYRKLAPATVIEFDIEGMKTSYYWRYDYNESAPKLSQSSYYTVYRNLMDRAVEGCMKGEHRIGTFLSGGYDSRVVAASIRKHHLPITSITFGLPESRDVRFAGLLAQRLSLNHIHLSKKELFLHKYCREIVWRTEGMLPFSETTSIRFHAELKQHMDIILTGFLGEFGGSHTWPQLLLARTRIQTINQIFRRYVLSRKDIVKNIFNLKFFNRTFDLLKHTFENSFEEIQNTHPHNIADSWNMRNKKTRSTNHSPNVDRHKFEIRAPHMDAELVEFLLTIPPWQRVEQRVYKKMIAYGYPGIRDIPCTNSGRPIDPVFIREYSKMVLDYVGRKTFSPVARRFSPRQKLGREFDDAGMQFRSEKNVVDEFLMPMVKEGVFPTTIFDHGGIKNIVDQHYSQQADHSLLIALLVSWGFSVKWFLHNQLDDAPEEMFVG